MEMLPGALPIGFWCKGRILLMSGLSGQLKLADLDQDTG